VYTKRPHVRKYSGDDCRGWWAANELGPRTIPPSLCLRTTSSPHDTKSDPIATARSAKSGAHNDAAT